MGNISMIPVDIVDEKKLIKIIEKQFSDAGLITENAIHPDPSKALVKC